MYRLFLIVLIVALVWIVTHWINRCKKQIPLGSLFVPSKYWSA